MKKVNRNIALDVDKAASVKKIAKNTYFRAKFNPYFHAIDKFKANQFTYASLTEDSISIIGRFVTPETMDFIAIILPRGAKTGPYPIVEWGGRGVYAVVATSGVMYDGSNGMLQLTQDKEHKTAEATFNFEITTTNGTYNVKGELSVIDTGPL